MNDHSPETADQATRGATAPEERTGRDAADGARVEPPESTAAASTPGWMRALRFFGLAALILVAFVVGTRFGGEGGAPADANAHDEQGGMWTCSMHPQIQRPEPGQCPICGMDLVPMTSGGGDTGSVHEVVLSERSRVLAQIQTAPVVVATAPARDLHLLGRLDLDETRVRTVTSWTEGRIDKLTVATTGQHVKRGQSIATVYSPEIYTAHQDLLTARRQLARMTDATPTARRAAETTLQSARQRIALLGVPQSDLTKMEAADAPWTQVRIQTPFAGTVVDRLVSEGAYVKAGTGLYKLVDLSTLWVQLDAYEADLEAIAIGQTVDLTFEAFAGETFTGTVAFIDPVVNARTRTVRVRVEVSNADDRLKPGMFAEAVVRAAGSADKAPLVIPDTAPLFTGRRSVVYVEVPGRDTPTFEAREVRLGQRAGDVYPVVAGLTEGERVVVHGAFRLDADLQLRGGQSMMTGDDDRSPGRFDNAMAVPADFVKALAPLLNAYLELQDALASDDFDRARQASASTRLAVDAVEPPKSPEVAAAWRESRASLLSDLRYMDAATTLDGARREFEPLTRSVELVLQRFGNPLPDELHVAFCPMAFDNRGARWLQRGNQVRNAYFGARMLACGEMKDTVAPGAHLGGGDAVAPELPREAGADGEEPVAEPVAPTPAPAKAHKGPTTPPASAPATQPMNHSMSQPKAATP